MHFNTGLLAALLAATTSARRIRFIPNAGTDCAGDGLPADSSAATGVINACFDISNANSFSWKFSSGPATQESWAKFRYYSETGCNGDVTAATCEPRRTDASSQDSLTLSMPGLDNVRRLKRCDEHDRHGAMHDFFQLEEPIKGSGNPRGCNAQCGAVQHAGVPSPCALSCLVFL